MQKELQPHHTPSVENKLVKQHHLLVVAHVNKTIKTANLSEHKPALQEQQPVGKHLTIVLQALKHADHHHNKVKY
jgi:hypothetical protein